MMHFGVEGGSLPMPCSLGGGGWGGLWGGRFAMAWEPPPPPRHVNARKHVNDANWCGPCILRRKA